MVSWAIKNIKFRLKGQLKTLRLAYVRRMYPFTKRDLQAVLRSLGVQEGDLLLVHSSFDRFEGFAGRATDVILALQESVSPSGTLLMPTMPFTGTVVDYASQRRIFDVTRTPSLMGWITELFRRSPGVVRSVHPTHPVAAWGARANDIIAEHYLAKTPCGRDTPWGRLLDFKGKILFLGTELGTMTFFHRIDEELEPEMPFSPFTKQVFSLLSKDKDGNIRVSNTRLFDPAYARRRNLNKMLPVLKECGYWRERSVGKLRVILLHAEEVLEACERLANKGVYCYDP